MNGSYKVHHSHERLNGGGTDSNQPWTNDTRPFDTTKIGGGVGGLASATRSTHNGGGGDVGLEKNQKMYNTVFVLGGPGSGKGTQVNCCGCWHLYLLLVSCWCHYIELGLHCYSFHLFFAYLNHLYVCVCVVECFHCERIWI